MPKKAVSFDKFDLLVKVNDPNSYGGFKTLKELEQWRREQRQKAIAERDLEEQRFAVLEALGISRSETPKIVNAHDHMSLGHFLMGFPKSMNDEKSLAEHKAALGVKRFNRIKQVVWGNSED